MEIQHSRHVRIVCDLNIGDIVGVDSDFGRKFSLVDLVIEDIRKADRYSQSGIMVKVDKIDMYLDSDWFYKKEKNESLLESIGIALKPERTVTTGFIIKSIMGLDTAGIHDELPESMSELRKITALLQDIIDCAYKHGAL